MWKLTLQERSCTPKVFSRKVIWSFFHRPYLSRGNLDLSFQLTSHQEISKWHELISKRGCLYANVSKFQQSFLPECKNESQNFKRLWRSKPPTYLLKGNNSNTRTKCKICSKLKIKTQKRRDGIVLMYLLLTLNLHSGAFIVNFEHNSHLVLVFLEVYNELMWHKFFTSNF